MINAIIEEKKFTDKKKPGISNINVIKRGDIPSIHSITIDGVTHNLGVLKDFKKNPILEQFLPKHATISLSWVRLKKDEILNTHEHPIDSMIIVTYGGVKLVGDKEDFLQDGDLVIIPRGCKHGLIGAGNDGFWGLSLQFELRGLYEEVDVPLVGFVNNSQKIVDKLIEDNKLFLEEFDKNSLFDLMRSGNLSDKKLRTKFLDCFQVFSNYFQKMMMNRVCFTEEGNYLNLFALHLDDEFGHNTKLSEDRKKRKPAWDTILEATSAWFANKMLSIDNVEKIVLVHLVVEASACIFYRNAGNIMNIDKGKSKHFEVHFSDIDTVHVDMGIKVLRESECQDYVKLSLIQKQGWEMLNTAFNRITQLVLSNSTI